LLKGPVQSLYDSLVRHRFSFAISLISLGILGVSFALLPAKDNTPEAIPSSGSPIAAGSIHYPELPHEIIPPQQNSTAPEVIASVSLEEPLPLPDAEFHPSSEPDLPESVTDTPIITDTSSEKRTVPTPPPTTHLTTAWTENAALSPSSFDKPLIAIVIDDLGIDRPRSQQVIELPVPLTLSFLPYASHLMEQVELGRSHGHELLVHIPMEALDRHNDPGPDALTIDLSSDEIIRRLDAALSKFNGYIGINNHMGSRFTMDAASLAPVMTALQQRGLLFLDSRTAPRSIAAATAIDFGVAAVARDVFIDHIKTPEAVREQLQVLEHIALKKGTAIGIGHPDDITLEALREWVPTVANRGFQLVPLSMVAKVRLWDRDKSHLARHP